MGTLGARLRKAREAKGLRQTQVKDRTGIHNKTLSGYENEVSEPDAETLKVLANLYEVSIDWLLGNDNKNRSINDQVKNAVMESYDRLSHEKKKLIDDMIKALTEEQRKT
jgi:transcriptional regulator with XRE-family HTH domain